MSDIREANPSTPAAKKGLFERLLTWLLPLLVVAYTKGKVVLLFAMKSAIFAPAITFLASWASYGVWLGWMAGIGLMVHLVVHEFGHYFAAKWLRLQVSLPKFVPFMGAWVSHKDPHCDYDNALIALGGPTAGLLLSVMCLACWYYLGAGSHFLLWMAATGFLLNLSNLIPINPLDGGHVVSKISPQLVKCVPYAAAFLVPAYGDTQITIMVVIVLMMGGLLSNKRLQLTFAAGIAVCALLWGPLWSLPIAAGFAFMALVNVEHYVRLAWMKFFALVFGPRRAASAPAEDVAADADENKENEKNKENEESADEPAASLPLTMPQRIGIGLWYVGLLVTGCPVGYWLFKLLTAQGH